MATKSFGVEEVQFGEIPTSGAEAGGMATVLAKLGNTYKDSATYEQADDEVFDINVEEQDEPEDSIVTAGKSTLTLDLIDYDPALLVKVCGGTVSADGKTWNEPATPAKIEMSVRVKQITGLVLEWPRMLIRYKLVPALKKNDAGRVRLICEKRRPAKAGLAAFSITKPDA